MAYLFISYPRRRAESVARLQALLEARGIEVWRDTEQLRFGTAWDARVTAAIRGSAMVVLFQSEEWFASGPCRSEADQARYYHRPIVTLSAHDSEVDLEEAAAFVAKRFAARPPEGDVVADLEVEAAEWARTGRRVRNLARRRNLRRFLPVAARPGAVTELAEDFVQQSLRWRRMVRASLSVLVMGVMASVMVLVAGAYQIGQVDEANQSNTALAERRTALESALLESPYAGAEAALAEDPASEGPTTLASYQDALEPCVPVAYAPAGGEAAGDASAVEALENAAFPQAGRTSATGAGWRASVSDDDRVLRIDQDGGAAGAGDGAAATAVLDAPCDDMAASPGGDVLAVVSAQGVQLFDPVFGTCFAELSGAPVAAGSVLSWSVDGTYLAMRAPDGSVAVWEPSPRTTVTASTGLWFMDGAIIADGSQVAFLARDGSIAVVDAATGEVLGLDTSLGGMLKTASDIAPGATAHEVLVVGVDTTGKRGLYLVDVAGHTAQVVNVPADVEPWYIATSPTADILALSDGAQTLVYDLATGEGLKRIENVSVSALAVDDEGRIYLGSFGGGGFSVVEPDSSVPADTTAASIDGVASVSATPGASPRAIAVGGTHAVSVGDGFEENGSLALAFEDGSWQLTTGFLTSWTPVDAHQARALAASPDGTVFAAGFSDGSVALLRDSDLYPGAVVREQGSEVRALAFSPDASALIVAMRDGTIARVEVDDGSFDAATLRERLRERLDTARALGLWE